MSTEACPKCALNLEAGFPFCDQCGVRLGECSTCRKVGFRKHCPADGAAIVFRTTAPEGAEVAPQPVANMERLCLQQVGGSILMDFQHEETIGRREGAFKHLLTPYTQISRAHATVGREPSGEWRVEDLGSRNKTFVDDVELAPRVPVALRVGSVVRFADVTFRVERP